jgi:predicted lipoprotein with Yx(FWY)xxD motif
MILALSSLAFTVSLQGAAPGDVTVQVSKDANLGDILTDGEGMTLYLFTKDQANVSNCYDQCAVSWPPLLVAAGKEASAGQGVTGKLGAIDRKDGSRQVTYNGWPLYFFAKDTKAGDTTGQNVGKVWFVVHPTDDAAAGVPAAAAPVAATPTVAAAAAPAEETPYVKVADQPIKDDMVTIAEVSSQGPGWIVIHADKNGAPGPVLGYTAVKDGENMNVAVKLAAEGRTDTLYAMLHTDAGAVGTYEFPGADIPVTVNGAVVTPAFKTTSAAPAALPTTGGEITPWTSILLLAVGGLALIGALGLSMSSRKR